MNTKNIFNPIRIAKLLCIGASSMLFSVSANAQLTERTYMAFRGKYEVKMISSQVLQSVWLSSTNPYRAIRPLSDDEMARDYTSLNNSTYLGGQAFYGTGTLLQTKPANAIDISQIYADCDDDMSTFQSSAAYLDLNSNSSSASIKAAYLYWSCYSGVSTTTSYAEHLNVSPTLRSMPVNSNEGLGGTEYQTVLFKAPGDLNYTKIKAHRTDINPDAAGERKICFADVTYFVQGKSSGLYWLANVRSGTGSGMGGASAGWTLVVVYSTPNSAPRTIKFWDGMLNLPSQTFHSFTFNFASGEVPATTNSTSYLGVAVLDGENTATYLSSSTYTPEYLEFYSKNTINGSTFKINPFAKGQTAPNPGEPLIGYPTYDRNGVLIAKSSEDGVSCSRISTYDPILGSNGNSIVRLPNQRNTLGYDAHHFKLPNGAMLPGATSAVMTYYAGAQGSTAPFMAYMAIEAARPVLKLKLRSEGIQKVQPDGEITYVLSVENTGTSALPAGAYVLDTLDKSVDFVPGSVQYVNKIDTLTSEILNQGADVNENLKLYLPTLAAGDGVNANDSVVIKFKVKVKDLSRMDIWNLICHRVVRNSAIAYYSNANGDSFTAVTNTPSGCGIPNEYYDVYVDDPAITQQHLITHYINDTIYEQLMAATQAGKIIRMDSLVRTYLADRLVTMGKPASEASLYTLLDENGLQVPTSAAFAFDESNQKFIAELDLGQGCIESFNFEFIIAPAISNLVIQNPHCIGYSDGKVSFTVSRGVPSYNCMLVDSITGKIVYQATAPSSASIASFDIANLPVGTYKLYVGDQGPLKAEAVVRIVTPKPLSVAISAPDSMCVSYDATLSAVVSGREAAIPLSYVWESSVDSVNWTGMSLTTQSIKTPISEDRYYRVYVCDNFCETYSDVKVVADLSTTCIPVSTDIKQAEEQSTVIYPNPVRTSFTIKTGKSQNDVNVYDMTGAILLQQLVSDKASVNISNLPKGNYVVDVNNERLIIIKE